MVKISIVMGYYNRRQQFLNTLEDIHKSSVPKEDYEIIVVDDASEVEHDLSDVKGIKLIKIPKDKKTWTCPVVPYNIGISQAKGDWIIIQNPEVMHNCEILDFLIKEGNIDTYYSICIYSLEDGFYKNVYRNGGDGWYSHFEHRPCFYHFCTAIHKSKLSLVGGFNNDMKNGIDYDDDEFVERIKRVCSLKYLNFKGMHQLHPKFSYIIDHDTLNYKRLENKKILDNTIKNKDFIYSDPLKGIDHLLSEI